MQNQPQNQQLSAQEAMALANSKDGQELLRALQHSHSAQMEQAFQLASAGDFAQLRSTVEKLMDTPEAKMLLNRLRGTDHG